MEVDVDLANYTTTPYSFDNNADAQVGPCQGCRGWPPAWQLATTAPKPLLAQSINLRINVCIVQL